MQNDSDEEAVSPMAAATMKALENKGVKVEDPTSLPDLQDSLQKLQRELAQLAGEPTTPAEVLKYDEGLQELAIQVAPEVQKNQAFLDTVRERGLQQEPAFVRRVKLAQEYLENIQGSKVSAYVSQVGMFLDLADVKRFSELREKLEELAEQKLAFVTRDPRRRDEPEAVVVRRNGEEVTYLPWQGSAISKHCWKHMVATRDRVKEAGARYRAGIGTQLEEFRERATEGLNPWKVLHEGAEGLIYLSTSFPETRRQEDERTGRFTYVETGRYRNARMLIRVGRGNFTVEEVFDPDWIDFILNQSHHRDGGIRWFPLDPEKFDPEKAPYAIGQIVWPAIKTWYRSLAIQAKSEISVVQLLANEPGFWGGFIPDATTYNRGPDDLTLGVRGTGKGTLILEEYLSRNGVFEFDELIGQEFPIEETRQEVPPEYLRIAIQARIVRGFLNLAAGWQRNSEILAQTRELEPKVTVTEGLEEEKVGHSIFHIPRAQIDDQGPAHLTCHVEWQEEGAVLLNYASWVDPREGKSRGPIELKVGVLVPRQPVENEESDIRVLRNLLSQRKEYETWKASQGEATEENNGAS